MLNVDEDLQQSVVLAICTSLLLAVPTGRGTTEKRRGACESNHRCVKNTNMTTSCLKCELHNNKPTGHSEGEPSGNGNQPESHLVLLPFDDLEAATAG